MIMIHQVRSAEGTVLIEQNDDTRTFSDFREDPPVVRPYTDDENAAADERIALEQADAVKAQIEGMLNDALAQLQAIIDDTNANINAAPAIRIKVLARTLKGIVRVLLHRFDSAV